jgi:hypothetical protein
VSDPEARYFGGRVEELSLVPLGEARLGHIGLDEWFRWATISLNGARSGPAISTMPFRGGASATSATTAATSSAAIGWNRPGEILTTFPSVLSAAMPPRNSRNWVERMTV